MIRTARNAKPLMRGGNPENSVAALFIAIPMNEISVGPY
jgi:hypothetical protein